MSRRVTFIGLLAAVALASSSFAQLVAPQFTGVGTRALGMGGAFVAVANDSTGAIWNPAGGAASSRWQIPLGVVGATQNLDANDIKDLIDDFDDAQAGNIAAATSLFNRALRGDTRPLIAATPYTTIGRFGGFTAFGYGSTIGGGVLVGTDANANGTFDATDTVGVTAVINALSNFGIAYSQTVQPGVRVGVSVKGVRMDSRAFQYTATPAGAVVPVTPAGGGIDSGTDLNDSDFSLDVGMLIHDAEKGINFGLVIRDLLRPQLTDTVTNGTFRMTVPRQVDVGISGQALGGTWAVDIHDLAGSRQGKSTLHVGFERQLTKNVAGRIGIYQLSGTEQVPGTGLAFDQDYTIVGGLGFNWGMLEISAAVGTTPTEFAAVELGLRF